MRTIILSIFISLASALFAQDILITERSARDGDREAMYKVALCYLHGDEGLPRDVNRGVEWLQKASKKKYAPAMTQLGLCYIKGIGVKANNKKALALFKKAMKKGDPDAQYYIAQMYKTGKLGKKNRPNDKEYMANLTEAAKNGSSLAEYDLGEMYLTSESAYRIPKDESRAFSLFSQAANKNNPDALYRLGQCYIEGIGTMPDYRKAFDCFYRATRAGSQEANFYLGICYFYGDGTQVDYADALRCFEKAAALNNPEAYTMLGVIYFYGKGVPKNTQRAIDFFIKGMQGGDAAAASELAGIYYDDSSLVAQPSKAYAQFSSAADTNAAGGYAGLGVCYEKGIGTEKSDPEAVNNYILAADRNDGFACYRLYNIFKNGQLGESKNSEQALKYLRKAVKLGYGPAQLQLAQEQFDGTIMAADPQGALTNLRKSADNGDAKACALLGNMYYKGNEHVKRDYYVAFKYYEMFLHDPDSVDRETRAKAYRNIAACYRFGRGTIVDPDKAATYTQKAIDSGDIELRKALD